MIVYLIALTESAEKAIETHGDKWKVMMTADSDLFGNPGPWLYVEPVKGSDEQKIKAARYVHQTDDISFSIIEE